jgi:hypothetical protein
MLPSPCTRAACGPGQPEALTAIAVASYDPMKGKLARLNSHILLLAPGGERVLSSCFGFPQVRPTRPPVVLVGGDRCCLSPPGPARRPRPPAYGRSRVVFPGGDRTRTCGELKINERTRQPEADRDHSGRPLSGAWRESLTRSAPAVSGRGTQT